MQAKIKALGACEQAVIKRKLAEGTDCHANPKVASAIGKATTNLTSAIAKACGGKDKSCGTVDDDALASIGWTIAQCPNLENGGCTNGIADCGGIGTCIGCIGEQAVDQANALYYGSRLPSDPKTEKALNKCQSTIGKAAAAFLATKSKLLAKCFAAVAKAGSGTCPDAKTATALAKASTKKSAAIAKACEGPDKTLGTGDDLTPAQIGFPATCLDASVPICAGPVTTLQQLIDCVDCVTEFKVDCVVAAAVPAFVSPYPSQCNQGTLPTTPTATVTATAGATPTVTATAAGTPAPTSSGVATPTATAIAPVATATPTETATPTPAAPTQTATATLTPTVTPTAMLACSGGQTHLTITMAAAQGNMGWLAGHDTSARHADTCTGGTNADAVCYQIKEGKCWGGPNDGAVCTSDSQCPGGTIPGNECACAGAATCTSKCIGGTNHGATCSVATQSQCPGGACTCVDGTTCMDQDSQICNGGTNVNGSCAADSACPGGVCYAAHNTWTTQACDAVGTDPAGSGYFPAYKIHHTTATNFKETGSSYEVWFRFDTSGIPSGSIVNSAAFSVLATSVVHEDTPTRNFVGSYYSDPGTFDCGDWVLDQTGTAAWSSSLSSIVAGQINTFPLSNVSSIVKGAGAKTAFRGWIDGGAPGPLCLGGTNNDGHCSAQGSTSECPGGWCDVGNDNAVFFLSSTSNPNPILEVCTTP
ncbi:MAG TPA: hypothetical protein VGK30_09795 [Candidatus Binatia bacterium]